MNIVEIINKKKNNEVLSNEEINYVINGFMNGEIKDYQMSSLLMTICFNGMNMEEIYFLVDAMVKSGNVINLSSINGIKVDKHSTGGIGDKTTLIVGPLVASCGVPFVKMSGRGLGYTGGTIDKLEAISGFRTNLSEEEFVRQINEINLSIISQTENIAPADKKIYALRDVTGTTNSIPLIASSIMSKKIASGADKIVLDVKYGIGALVKDKEAAIELAKIMVKIGNRYNKKTIAILSNMDNPLGNMIGNGLEVKEAIDILSYRGNKELKELCLVLAAYMVSLSKNIDYKEARDMVVNNLINGKALNKFKDMILKQGGNIDNIKISNNIIEVKSNKNGYINGINALSIGKLVMNLGAGRLSKEQGINHGVGIELVKNVGDNVKVGDVIARVYYENKTIDLNDVIESFKIEDNLVNKEYIVLGVIQ
ncbi:MAG: thymidine phosphorylase [Tenericutes bacterium]|nr:thymidine phosphorylase [Mycoplasmatota bacterium]